MTDELKNLLKTAKTEEEAEEILEAHKDEISDDDLDELKGGSLISIVFLTIKIC